MLALGLASVIAWRESRLAHERLAELQRAVTLIEPQARSLPEAKLPKPAFVEHLPREAPDAAVVVAQIQKAAASVGVVLASVSVTLQAPTPSALARLDLELELKGSYTGIKQVIVDTMGRHASATLRSLRIRAETPPAPTQASLTLAFWAQAAPAEQIR